jgi:hypothetical protein
MTLLDRALCRADRGRRLLLRRARRSVADPWSGLRTPWLSISCRCSGGIASLPLVPLLYSTHPAVPCQEQPGTPLSTDAGLCSCRRAGCRASRERMSRSIARMVPLCSVAGTSASSAADRRRLMSVWAELPCLTAGRGLAWRYAGTSVARGQRCVCPALLCGSAADQD